MECVEFRKSKNKKKIGKRGNKKTSVMGEKIWEDKEDEGREKNWIQEMEPISSLGGQFHQLRWAEGPPWVGTVALWSGSEALRQMRAADAERDRFASAFPVAWFFPLLPPLHQWPLLNLCIFHQYGNTSLCSNISMSKWTHSTPA